MAAHFGLEQRFGVFVLVDMVSQHKVATGNLDGTILVEIYKLQLY